MPGGSKQGAPLHMAAAHAHPKVVQALLQGGADANATNAHGFTPLHTACASCADAEVTAHLLAGGANPDAKTKQQQTPLMLLVQEACSGTDTSTSSSSIADLVQQLLAAGADPGLEDAEGISALRMAMSSTVWFTDLLPGSDGSYASSAASSRGLGCDSADILQQLLASDRGSDAAPLAKFMALADAFGRKDRAAAQQVLDMGGLETVVNKGGDGVTLLHVAADLGYADITQQLLHMGASPHAEHRCWRYTPLHYAVVKGHTAAAGALLAAGANPFRYDYEGLTPLHRASDAGQTDIVKLMLAAPARQGREDAVNGMVRKDVKSRDDVVLETALHRAVSCRQVEVVRELLLGGADASIRDSMGRDALALACQVWAPPWGGFGSPEGAELVTLLVTPATAHTVLSSGQTLLQRAVEKQEVELAAALAAAGASSLVVDSQGYPLLETTAALVAGPGGSLWTHVVQVMLEKALPAYTQQHLKQQQPPQQQQPQQQQGPQQAQPQQQQQQQLAPQQPPPQQQQGGEGTNQQPAGSPHHPVVRAIYRALIAAADPEVSIWAASRCLAAAVGALGAAGAPGLWSDLLAYHASLEQQYQAPGAALVRALAQGCLLARAPRRQLHVAVVWRLQQLVLGPGGSNTLHAQKAAAAGPLVSTAAADGAGERSSGGAAAAVGAGGSAASGPMGGWYEGAAAPCLDDSEEQEEEAQQQEQDVQAAPCFGDSQEQDEDVQAAALADSAWWAASEGDVAHCPRLVENLFCVAEAQAAALLDSIMLAALARHEQGPEVEQDAGQEEGAEMGLQAWEEEGAEVGLEAWEEQGQQVGQEAAGQEEGPEVGLQAAALCEALLAAWPEGGSAQPLQQELVDAVTRAVLVCRQGRPTRREFG